MRLRFLPGLISLAALAGLTAQAHPDRLEWRRGTYTVALLRDGRVVWQFHYGSGLSKTYFHPVALSGGPDLTWLSPKDHPHHFALFFSWKYLNHVNYWEEPGGVPEGRTRWTDVSVETRRDWSAKIALNLQYRPNSAARDVLSEKRAIVISPPASDGAYSMDWDMEFKAGSEDVVLDRTPPDTAPDGNARGGYAGLSVRLARELTDPEVNATTPVGTRVKERYGFAAAAADFSGIIDCAEAGIAFFDHPSNPRYPTRWYGIMDGSVPFWYLNASLLQLESCTLPAHGTCRLRYRVCVHPGRWDASRLVKEHSLYVGAK